MHSLSLLYLLIIAHLLGDFWFQSDKLVKEKEKNGVKSYHLYIHSLLQGILAWLCICKLSAWWVVVVVVVSHFIIDLAKIKIKGIETSKLLVDQILHILIILFSWLVYTDQLDYWLSIITVPEKTYIYLLFLLLLLKPSSLFIARFFGGWVRFSQGGLRGAGMWIGYLERILVFLFICYSMYEAIGFLVAAKSILRVGEKNDRKQTEYILMGTLLSFTIAIGFGFLARILTNG